MATTGPAADVIVFGPTSGQHLRRRAEDRAAELTSATGTRHDVGWEWVDGVQMFVIVVDTDAAATSS